MSESVSPYDALNEMQREFLITHKLGPGGENYRHLTAIMQFPNAAGHPDAEVAKRLLDKDIQVAKQKGVPEDLLEAVIELALQSRGLLISAGIRTGSLSRGDFV